MLVIVAGMLDLIEYKAQRFAQGVVSDREVEGGDSGSKRRTAQAEDITGDDKFRQEGEADFNVGLFCG